MRLTWMWGALGALGVAAAANCQTVPDFGAPIPCDPDAGICPNPGAAAAGAGVGGSTSSAGVGGHGTGAGTTVTGNVDLLSSPDFNPTLGTPFQGAATVTAYTGAGQLTEMYGGSGAGGGSTTGGGSFVFPSVPNGLTWFFVTAGTNSSTIPTLSPVVLPSPGVLTVPVVDQTMMQNIATNLPNLATVGVSAQASQIVVLITNMGAPYAGVTVTGATGGADVAYDTGNGVYSDMSSMTGTAGTVIFFNSALSGMTTLTFTDMNMKANSIQVLAGHGSVTLASLAWQ